MGNTLTFRLCAGIRFNRPVDGEKDYISPGGYKFLSGKKKMEFDFGEFTGSVRKNDPCILDMEAKNLMYPEYPEAENITEEMLENTTGIEEFFVFTGEPGESDLYPVGLEYVSFLLPYDRFKRIDVKKDVVREANIGESI